MEPVSHSMFDIGDSFEVLFNSAADMDQFPENKPSSFTNVFQAIEDTTRIHAIALESIRVIPRLDAPPPPPDAVIASIKATIQAYDQPDFDNNLLVRLPLFYTLYTEAAGGTLLKPLPAGTLKLAFHEDQTVDVPFPPGTLVEDVDLSSVLSLFGPDFTDDMAAHFFPADDAPYIQTKWNPDGEAISVADGGFYADESIGNVPDGSTSFSGSYTRISDHLSNAVSNNGKGFYSLYAPPDVRADISAYCKYHSGRTTFLAFKTGATTNWTINVDITDTLGNVTDQSIACVTNIHPTFDLPPGRHYSPFLNFGGPFWNTAGSDPVPVPETHPPLMFPFWPPNVYHSQRTGDVTLEVVPPSAGVTLIPANSFATPGQYAWTSTTQLSHVNAVKLNAISSPAPRICYKRRQNFYVGPSLKRHRLLASPPYEGVANFYLQIHSPILTTDYFAGGFASQILKLIYIDPNEIPNPSAVVPYNNFKWRSTSQTHISTIEFNIYDGNGNSHPLLETDVVVTLCCRCI
jgi:hypothetical protein